MSFSFLYIDIQSPLKQFEIRNLFSGSLSVYILILLKNLIALKLHMNISDILNLKFNDSPEVKPIDRKNNVEEFDLLVKLRRQNTIKRGSYKKGQLRDMTVYYKYYPCGASLSPQNIMYLHSLFADNCHPSFIMKATKRGSHEIKLHYRHLNIEGERVAKPTQELINVVEAKLKLLNTK
jgi:hypothetical protein